MIDYIFSTCNSDNDSNSSIVRVHIGSPIYIYFNPSIIRLPPQINIPFITFFCFRFTFRLSKAFTNLKNARDNTLNVDILPSKNPFTSYFPNISACKQDSNQHNFSFKLFCNPGKPIHKRRDVIQFKVQTMVDFIPYTPYPYASK